MIGDGRVLPLFSANAMKGQRMEIENRLNIGQKTYIMQYIDTYASPLGNMILAAEKDRLTGLWFEDQQYFAATRKGVFKEKWGSKEKEGFWEREIFKEEGVFKEKESTVFQETKRWLDCYFSGDDPDFMPFIRLESTPFRLAVWKILRGIPYGSVVTYKEIAEEMAKATGKRRMSAQAVGGAVGHNPISILIPCHRVIGSDGSMTGYAGGIDRKVRLLELEGVNIEKKIIRTYS